jgi:hypothetical protein
MVLDAFINRRLYPGDDLIGMNLKTSAIAGILSSDFIASMTN